ncbi:MAG: TonB-dependent receptor [Acidobacteria bacterium]|nr:TonB-dependent receptor [Acidobacteriota bacterium]
MYRRTAVISIKKIISQAFALVLLTLSFASVSWAFDGTVTGVVKDPSGAVVAEATVALLTAQQTSVAATKTDAQGRFHFADIPAGNYLLLVSGRGFADQREAINTRLSSAAIAVTLEPRLDAEQVSITANLGSVEDIDNLTQQVNVINEEVIAERAKSVTAQIANEEVGVYLQRTSPTISGIFVRGLTGNKVSVFVDGVRYSTSAMRGGINTFFNLLDASNLQAAEILRGPNSAQYGSDALGGSVQLLTRVPALAADGTLRETRLSAFYNSSDHGFGSSLATSYGTKHFALLTNLTAHRANPLRGGGGIDSRNAVTRFFGLPSKIVIGDRLPDTGFTQYGGMLKLNYSPTVKHQFIASYLRGQQDGGKRYDQLIGGDGNLIADLRNLMNDLFYARYNRLGVGIFDTFSATYSFNKQREERVNQGGNGNPNASINHEYESTKAHGLQAHLGKQLGAKNSLLLGGDYYFETIAAPSFGVNPTTHVTSIRRGRVPDGANYKQGGIYVQEVFDALANKLRLVGNLRYSRAAYQSRAANSPLLNGKPLWPDDAINFDAVTFRFGVIVTPIKGLSFLANLARGYRTPHITDLGTLGLTGDGFEVAAPEVAGLGGTVGSTADSRAVSSGRPVQQLQPESSLNYEVGVRYRHQRFDSDFAFFINDINDNIQKQALILPQGAVGIKLGDQTITAQLPNGTVFVPVAVATPVLVRANFDKARLYGFEHKLDVGLTSALSASTVFTYIHAEDKTTHLPPNIEGGTPAPDFYLKLRYAPTGSKFWLEPYLHAAAKQDRLSTLDLGDRRTGAARTRGSIQSFFRNGARVRGLIEAGADGVFGTADDQLKATGETLMQVQDRVLGAGVNSSFLFTQLPGYVTINLRGGFKFAERHEVMIEFENIGDKNYRGISWGVDAPGRGVFVRYSTRL